MLGKRGSSVFHAPPRLLLDENCAGDYDVANRRARSIPSGGRAGEAGRIWY